MERIVVMGSPGAGKSRFARMLGARLGLPVIYLDVLYYGPHWTAGDSGVFRERLRKAMAPGRWISDGNFVSQTADLRFPAADTIVILDQPVWVRIARAMGRAVRPDTLRRDLPPGCRDSFDLSLLRDILRFERDDKPKIEAAIDRHARGAQVFRLEGDAQIRAFLGSAAKLAA